MSFMAAPSDETLRGRWKWFVGVGILLVIVGLIALANVVDATLITTVIVGIALVFGGTMQIVGAWAAEGSTGRRVLMAALGVIYIIVGVNVIADPLAGVVGLTVVVALFLIVDGVLRIFSALVPETENKVLTIVFGIVMIILGGWLWSGIPAAASQSGSSSASSCSSPASSGSCLGLTARSSHGGAAPVEATA